MGNQEPESWTFSNTTFKRYDSDTESSSGDDDFSKVKPIGKKKFKKIIHIDDLLPE